MRLYGGQYDPINFIYYIYSLKLWVSVLYKRNINYKKKRRGSEPQMWPFTTTNKNGMTWCRSIRDNDFQLIPLPPSQSWNLKSMVVVRWRWNRWIRHSLLSRFQLSMLSPSHNSSAWAPFIHLQSWLRIAVVLSVRGISTDSTWRAKRWVPSVGQDS